jgi:hypothetical protein
LFPFLFLFVADALSALVNKAVMEGGLDSVMIYVANRPTYIIKLQLLSTFDNIRIQERAFRQGDNAGLQ